MRGRKPIQYSYFIKRLMQAMYRADIPLTIIAERLGITVHAVRCNIGTQLDGQELTDAQQEIVDRYETLANYDWRQLEQLNG